MSIIKDCCLLYLTLLLITYFILTIYKLKFEFIEQKEYFIKTLGHDIRVPLIAQIRGLELVLKTLNLSNGEQNLIEEVNKSCKYTMDLITMLLKTYQIETGDTKLKYENMDIKNIIFNIFAGYKQLANEKNINLQCSVDDCTLYVDREAFTKALKILIHISLQYSNPNQIISITIQNKSNKPSLSISYTGKHLSDEEYRRMFAKNPKFSTVGHGIQMYLCKKIIELHRGKISFQKGSEGLSLFKITMPNNNRRGHCKNLRNKHIKICTATLQNLI